MREFKYGDFAYIKAGDQYYKVNAMSKNTKPGYEGFYYVDFVHNHEPHLVHVDDLISEDEYNKAIHADEFNKSLEKEINE